MNDPRVPLLDEQDFALLAPAEQDLYLRLLAEDQERWRLTAKQAWADLLADRVDEICYGGAVGGAKSEWVVWRAHRKSLTIPGHRTLVLRTSFPELRRSIIMRSIVRIPAGSATYRAADKEWHYPNRSVIEFGYLSSDEDTRQYLSAEYDMIEFDESSSFTVQQVLLVGSRARTTVVKRRAGARPHLVLTTNPGGPGHAHHKRRYIVPTQRGTRIAIFDAEGDPEDPNLSPLDTITLPPMPAHPEDFAAVERLREVLAEIPPSSDNEIATAFVPATLDDNPHIDKAYKRRINALPEIERRQAWGDWDVFAGQFFSEFSPSVHIVEPFPIPPEWFRGRGLDYGFAAPFGCLWGAWDPDGNCYIYREVYATRVTPAAQATMVRQASTYIDEAGREQPETIQLTVADPSVFSYTGAGDPISQQWLRAGLPVRKANNARIDGWANVREYLKLDDDGHAKLRIFSTCPDLIRTLPDMVHDKTRPEDLDTHTEDHLPDCLRYLLSLRPMRRITRSRHRRGGTLQEAADRDFQRIARGKRGHNVWRVS